MKIHSILDEASAPFVSDSWRANAFALRLRGCYILSMNSREFALMKTGLPVWSDPDRLGGRICFKGTRVPVDALFENLEAGLNLEEFLDEFEGVTREQAVAVLEYARHSLSEPAHA